MLKQCLKQLSEGQTPSTEDIRASVAEMMGSGAGGAGGAGGGAATSTTPSQIGAFLLALNMRGLTTRPEVIKACADVLLEHAHPCVAVGPGGASDVVVDIVGTGGDGMDTFNVSTASSIVLAACGGVAVAKHGNRSSSGNVGSADFLEALGARIDLDGEATASVLAGCGFAFLFAQQFHPAMKRVAAPRKQLGVRTVFNLLGPLTNPARPSRQVIGVGAASLGQPFADLFCLKNTEHTLIVHSTDGLDELSPAAPSDVWEVKGGKIVRQFRVSPADLGLDTHPLDTVCGGSAKDRAASFRAALAGERGPIRDYIVLNAAAAAYVSGLAPDLAAGARLVETVLDNGAAAKVCDAYVALTHKHGPASATAGGAGAPAGSEPQAAPLPPTTYVTEGGIEVTRRTESVIAAEAMAELVDAVDTRRGVVLASNYEYPGRYTRWDTGFVDPPLVISGHGREFSVEALNARGECLLPAVHAKLAQLTCLASLGEASTTSFAGTVAIPEKRFSEEERSKQPSLFSVVRAVIELFRSDQDPGVLGLYGAFGYDLTFQFEAVTLKHQRAADQRDLVLYLPDALVQVDHAKQHATRQLYDFSYTDASGTVHSTANLPRTGVALPFVGSESAPPGDHQPGQYAEKVEVARKKFHAGDLFEAVLSQTFYRPCPAPPSRLFRILRERNPSPYGFTINLGNAEFLVGASPEMYVRVQTDGRVETCPISGTIKRGEDPIADASQVLELLNSKKDESELTMCTDVDRNDKSRVCEPGSVRVIARRQIEMYSKLIHTVDHVEGYLRPGFDALDAFLVHTWAVTVTGAPKAWAMQFVEDQEESPRRWYAGAVGALSFDGSMNTGLTLRTIHVNKGVASVRAGATLLWDSDPHAEEEETKLKASAFLDALDPALHKDQPTLPASTTGAGHGLSVLLIDHEDSFVHTLGNYIRQTGASLTTVRARFPFEFLDQHQFDLAVMSPGPGCPKDFETSACLAALLERGIPVFGVCLGLQAMVEHLGGDLRTLEEPVHGKPSYITAQNDSVMFAGMPSRFVAARYHSIYAGKDTLPEELRVVAETDDGLIMAIEHKTLPMAAVQFHPESILTSHAHGIAILENVFKRFCKKATAAESQ